VGVVEEVIVLERRGHRDADGQVGKQREKAIVQRTAECEVVRQLVDREQECVVHDAAERVANADDRPPRRVAKKVRRHELRGDQRGDDVLGARARTEELADFGMREQHEPPPFGVRLRPFAPAKRARVAVLGARCVIQAADGIRHLERLPSFRLLVNASNRTAKTPREESKILALWRFVFCVH
jgi:hypothetical protein